MLAKERFLKGTSTPWRPFYIFKGEKKHVAENQLFKPIATAGYFCLERCRRQGRSIAIFLPGYILYLGFASPKWLLQAFTKLYQANAWRYELLLAWCNQTEVPPRASCPLEATLLDVMPTVVVEGTMQFPNNRLTSWGAQRGGWGHTMPSVAPFLELQTVVS